MYVLSVVQTGEGPHPSEIEIGIDTADQGREHAYVWRGSFRNGAISIGYPVGQDGDRLLVELPRETHTGCWRVWVPKEAVRLAGDVLESVGQHSSVM